MGVDRREFLKIAGYAALFGLGGKAAIDILAPGQLEAAMEGVPLTEATRWSMVIRMRNCLEKVEKDGCKECISACHRVHNVPDWGNPKHEIKWIWKEAYQNSFPNHPNEFIDEGINDKPFILLCNHCLNPPCVRVCPTKATFKRPDGIVAMDMHRCIGCRFCMAGCPYGSRSFNWGSPRKAPKELNPDFPTNRDFPERSKGVVEKCNFCVELVAKGQLPVCVETCDKIKVHALNFGDLDDPESNVRRLLRKHYSVRRKPALGTEPNIFYII
ncbi:MAG: 4Fe-4S dicluster domain-containing protein [Desulfobacteraceae bacterium]|nr:4Fe-4S dicluster domain-containing protein [Desulfobacteraceae bacterium]